MKIIIEISELNQDEFFNGFNKTIVKPPKYQHMTDIQFLEQWITDVIDNAYKTGKIIIARETTKPNFIDKIAEVNIEEKL